VLTNYIEFKKRSNGIMFM